MGCQDGRGEYPTGGTMGKAFCLFDTLGLVRISDFYLITLQRIQGCLQNSNIKNLQNSLKKIITEFFKKIITEFYAENSIQKFLQDPFIESSQNSLDNSLNSLQNPL